MRGNKQPHIEYRIHPNKQSKTRLLSRCKQYHRIHGFRSNCKKSPRRKPPRYNRSPPLSSPRSPTNSFGIYSTLSHLACSRQIIPNHSPFSIQIGGATGSIGDPSGRSTERVALDPATLHANVNAIQSQLAEIFDNATNYIIAKNALSVPSQNIKPVKVLNNLDWFNNMSILDFLADTGRLARVSIMLARESVKNRLQSPEGISFTEFSYQLLQAYDFYHLYSSHNCKIQIGGSDQWGNIMAGMDIIRKKLSSHNHSPDPSSNPSPESDIEPTAFALTMPLVTTATGEKFGKSAGNAIWLDENMLSHYDFYQVPLLARQLSPALVTCL